MSKKYFEATVAFIEKVETKNGVKDKKSKEKYLVDAETPTIVEARIYEFLKGLQMEFNVERVVESKIIEVF